MSGDTEIRLTAGRPSRGKYPVSLMRAGDVLLTGKVNPHVSDEIESFIKLACKKFRGLKKRAKDLRQELLNLAAPRSAPRLPTEPLDHPYAETPAGIVRMKMLGESEIIEPLTNFLARIVADIVKDDGAESEHAFEIVARMAGMAEKTFSIPASQFSLMNWPIEKMGATAIVYPGQGARDHARAAIQHFSSGLVPRVIYTHTGWRKFGDIWVYLHADGAIGASGPVEGIDVELPDALSRYALPNPPDGDDLVRCVRASIGMIDVGPNIITLPLFCSIFRAPLGNCDLAEHLAGPTGAFKSELAALANQHFGAGLDRLNLPGSWTSTENALEGLGFAAKDVLLTIDDFVPGGTGIDVQKLHQKADRIIRAQGNHSGRQRMRADGSLRPVKPPRCLILSTGEDIPRGQSLRARMLVSELGDKDISPEKLGRCQSDARQGLYAGAMAGYVRWLATRLDEIHSGMKTQLVDFRERAALSSMHRRTPDLVANLGIGLIHFLDYAKQAGAITDVKSRELWKRGWAALGAAADKQAGHQAASEPTRRFLELIAAAIASGNAHLAGSDGREPAAPAASGWRQRTAGALSEWQAQGDRIGWLTEDELYLEPDASYRVAQSMAGANVDGLSITARTLRKRLDEKGLLIREGNRDELTVRRMLEGSSRRVLSLAPRCIHLEEPAKPTISPTDASDEAVNGESMAGQMAGCAISKERIRHPNQPLTELGAIENANVGGNGGNGGLARVGTHDKVVIEL